MNSAEKPSLPLKRMVIGIGAAQGSAVICSGETSLSRRTWQAGFLSGTQMHHAKGIAGCAVALSPARMVIGERSVRTDAEKARDASAFFVVLSSPQ